MRASRTVQRAADPRPRSATALDDDCNGAVDEAFEDALGRYATPQACGSCALDCTFAVPQPGARRRRGAAGRGRLPAGRRGAPRCVPRLCERATSPRRPAPASSARRWSAPSAGPAPSTATVACPATSAPPWSNDPGSYCLQSCEASAPYTGLHRRPPACRAAAPPARPARASRARSAACPTTSSCSCTPARVGFSRSCVRGFGTALCVGEQVCEADGGFDVLRHLAHRARAVRRPRQRLQREDRRPLHQHPGHRHLRHRPALRQLHHQLPGAVEPHHSARDRRLPAGARLGRPGLPDRRLHRRPRAGRRALPSRRRLPAPARSCDPLYHQCVQACTAAGCRARARRASNGGCTQSLQQRRDCAARTAPPRPAATRARAR